MTHRALLWLATALLGIVATAALAWAASQVAGQRIGLAAAPLSVQRGLAPSSSRGNRKREREGTVHHPGSSHRRIGVVTVPKASTPGQITSAPTTTITATTSAPAATSAPATTSPAAVPSSSPPTMNRISPQPASKRPQERDDNGGQHAQPGGSSTHPDD